MNSYVDLHRLKGSISNKKNLANLILDDCLDDLLGAFREDQVSIDYILKEQVRISHKYNHLVDSVTKWHIHNKDLDRKSFAILTKDKMEFCMSLCMHLYNDKPIDYKDFFIKNRMYK